MTTVSLTAIAGWLLTYLVHSTLLLAGVALITWRVVRRESLRETLWKAALVGGVVTATAAVALPRPGVARVHVAALGVSTVGDPIAPVEGAGVGARLASDAAGSTDEPTWSETTTERDRDADAEVEGYAERESGGEAVGRGTAGVMGPGSTAGPGGSGGSGSPGQAGWLLVMVLGWAAVAGVLLGRLGYRHLRLRWLLRDRTQVPGTERAASMLTELRRTAGVWRPVRLTTTPAVASPLALGAVEICVPERFLTELGEEEQRAALAHELAHLARRDPVWQVWGSVLGAVFFFQPLNGVARRAIRSAAEYLADGWAVAQTGSRVELARCLAAVAGWVAPSSGPSLAGTVAMAEGGSPLLDRVQRLLEREPEAPAGGAVRLAVAAALIAVTAGFGPTVGSGADAAAGPSEWREGAVEPGVELPDSDRPAQDSLVVHRFDRPGVEGDGFVARLNEAGRDARQSPYWVAYAIPSVEGSRRMIVDTEPWVSRELEGEPVSALLGVESALAEAGPYPVLVLARLVPRGPSTRVDRLTVRRPDLGMALTGSVYWLGRAEPVESYRWLRDIYLAVREPELRRTVVEAVSVHATPEADAFLRRVLDEDTDSDTREEAMEGLAQRPDTAVARLLFGVALNDRMPGVRQEAAEQLGRVEASMAVVLLERLARESDDPGVQRQAAESLGEVGGPAAVAALGRLLDSHPAERVRREALDQLSRRDGGISGDGLLSMALRDGDPEVRRDAVELMEKLPPDLAVALLRRAAFESGDGTVERQAAESLGEVSTRAALAVLVEILDLNPGEDASFQAVESIAENFPSELAIPILREVLSRHPSERVRREALDALGDLGG